MPAYLTIGFSSGSLAYGNAACCGGSANIKCLSAINFLDTLTGKLLDMTVALQKQFNECKATTATQEAGFILASIDAPAMSIGIKYEYIVYIQRYGPPNDGIFDEAILAQLRTELGITNAL